MMLRSPWFGRRRPALPPEPQTAAQIRARRAARALAREHRGGYPSSAESPSPPKPPPGPGPGAPTVRHHTDGSHCHHCPEDR